jgi:hypothetical protein
MNIILKSLSRMICPFAAAFLTRSPTQVAPCRGRRLGVTGAKMGLHFAPFSLNTSRQRSLRLRFLHSFAFWRPFACWYALQSQVAKGSFLIPREVPARPIPATGPNTTERNPADRITPNVKHVPSHEMTHLHFVQCKLQSHHIPLALPMRTASTTDDANDDANNITNDDTNDDADDRARELRRRWRRPCQP